MTITAPEHGDTEDWPHTGHSHLAGPALACTAMHQARHQWSPSPGAQIRFIETERCGAMRKTTEVLDRWILDIAYTLIMSSDAIDYQCYEFYTIQCVICIYENCYIASVMSSSLADSASLPSVAF